MTTRRGQTPPETVNTDEVLYKFDEEFFNGLATLLYKYKTLGFKAVDSPSLEDINEALFNYAPVYYALSKRVAEARLEFTNKEIDFDCWKSSICVDIKARYKDEAKTKWPSITEIEQILIHENKTEYRRLKVGLEESKGALETLKEYIKSWQAYANVLGYLSKNVVHEARLASDEFSL